MKRILLSCGAFIAIAGGCSSTTNGYGFSDAGPDAASSIIPDAGGADALAKRKDAGRDSGDVAIDEDAAPPKRRDAGNPPPPPTCAPDAVTGFSPTWHAPKRIPGACTATQIDTILDCMLDAAANATTCKTILADTANKNCITCAMTPSTAATYGPLIAGDGLITLNLAGCVALKSSNVAATGCAAKYQALSECSDSACAANCPVTDDATFAEYTQCLGTAETGVCAAYVTPSQCIDPLTQVGGVAAACDIGSGGAFIDNAKTFTTIFCQ